MKVLNKFEDKLTLYAPVEKPSKNSNSNGATIYLKILSYAGEMATTDEGLLAKKYKTLTTNVIPKLVKYGYITKQKSKTVVTSQISRFGKEYGKIKSNIHSSHQLTMIGKRALLYQNKNAFGYELKQTLTSNVPSYYKRRFNSQDISSLLVLYELLDIDYFYDSHPHIGNEILYENNIFDHNDNYELLKEGLEKCYSEKPIGYATKIFSNTVDYMDYFLGMVCRGFICYNKETFPVYVFDNYDVKTEQRRFIAKNEKNKILNAFSQENVKKSTPYQYPLKTSKNFIGNAFCTVATNSRIENIFDIKKSPLKKVDEYGFVKTQSYKLIKTLVSIGYEHIYLLVRNYKFLKEQYNLCIAKYEDKEKINSSILKNQELDTSNYFLKEYYRKNKYIGKNVKYGYNMEKVAAYDICPTHHFTILGNPIYLLWDLDIIKIHKAIVDFSEKEKIFYFFEEQKDIVLSILNCYKYSNKKLGVTINFVSMKNALNFIDYNSQ